MKVKYEGGQVLTDVMPDLKKTEIFFRCSAVFHLLRDQRRRFWYRVHHSGFRSGNDAGASRDHTIDVGVAYGTLCIGADQSAPVDSGPYVWVKMASVSSGGLPLVCGWL